MRHFLAVLSIVFLCTSLNAQVRYEAGWFTDNKGNRTECLIKNTGRFCAATQLTYKMDEHSEKQVAPIAEVASFFLNGTLYERHSFSYDASTSDINAGYSQSAQPDLVPVTAFLRVVCDGPAKLYRYDLANVKDNFFISTPSAPHPAYLVSKTYIHGRGVAPVRENNAFRQQLFTLLAPTGITEDDVKDLAYDEAALIRVFDKSNGTTTVRKRDGKMNLDVLLSYRPADEGQAIGVGVSLENLYARSSYKWASFYTLEYKNQRNVWDETVKGEIVPVRYQQHVVEVVVGARYYMYPARNLRLYLDAGFGMGVGAFDNILLGAGMKAGNYAAVGVRTSVSYIRLLSFGKTGGEQFFENAWPVTFYAKFSIPLKTGK